MKLPKTTEKISLKSLQTNLDSDSPRQRFTWNDQSIQWYLTSETTTNFYQRTLKILNPYIKNSNIVLDIGCGIGSFSIAFAKRGFYVTAIDPSSVAIESLKKRIQEMNLENIEALPISLEDFKFSQKYDVIFASYVMGLIGEEHIDRILQYTNHHLIFLLPFSKIKNDFSIEELYRELKIHTKHLEQSNYLEVLKILDKKNIKYHIEIFESDFGQPFETIKEGLDFINYYFHIPKKHYKRVEDWLERKFIIRDHKYYLPNQKESAMIIIEK